MFEPGATSSSMYSNESHVEIFIIHIEFKGFYVLGRSEWETLEYEYAARFDEKGFQRLNLPLHRHMERDKNFPAA